MYSVFLAHFSSPLARVITISVPGVSECEVFWVRCNDTSVCIPAALIDPGSSEWINIYLSLHTAAAIHFTCDILVTVPENL